ncbi:hypothetical protein CF328_g3735 [Tilletia controversa]|nr:hypothetical protein CF328_g3735 [Tilletia controversa]
MGNMTYTIPNNDTTSLHVQTVASEQLPTVHIFQLPEAAAAGQSGRVHTEVDHGSIKLHMRPSINGSNEDIPGTLPLSHHLLTAIQCEGLICDGCLAPLARWSAAVTYRALPSDHWEELVEAWMCHADQRLHESIAKGRDAVQRSGAGDERDEVWVGDFHLAVSRVKVTGATVPIDSQVPFHHSGDRRPVVCQQCGYGVGHEVLDGDRALAADSAIRFFKYAVRPISATLQLPSSLSVVVANQLVNLADMYSSRHFELVTEGTDSIICQLWLFAPRCRMVLDLEGPWRDLAWRRSADGPASGSSAFTAAKIFYRALVSDTTTLAPIPLPRSERLELPGPVCARVMERLRLSTGMYPSSRRAFGPWTVGWLEV